MKKFLLLIALFSLFSTNIFAKEFFMVSSKNSAQNEIIKLEKFGFKVCEIKALDNDASGYVLIIYEC